MDEEFFAADEPELSDGAADDGDLAELAAPDSAIDPVADSGPDDLDDGELVAAPDAELADAATQGQLATDFDVAPLGEVWVDLAEYSDSDSHELAVYPEPVVEVSADFEPVALDRDAVSEPVDGWPWADPSLLGEGEVAEPYAHLDVTVPVDAAVLTADLAAYEAGDVASSADPAVSALSQLWGLAAEA